MSLESDGHGLMSHVFENGRVCILGISSSPVNCSRRVCIFVLLETEQQIKDPLNCFVTLPDF